jgi:hypothetical protein
MQALFGLWQSRKSRRQELCRRRPEPAEPTGSAGSVRRNRSSFPVIRLVLGAMLVNVI